MLKSIQKQAPIKVSRKTWALCNQELQDLHNFLVIEDLRSKTLCDNPRGFV